MSASHDRLERRFKSQAVLGLLLLGLAGVTAGDEPAPRLDPAAVRELRQQAEANTSLGDDLRDRILGLYDEALGALEADAASRARAAAHQRERTAVAPAVEKLRRELAKPPAEPPPDPPDDATAEDVDGWRTRAT